MNETQGTVIALDGDFAVVRVEESNGCGRCHEQGGCGGHNTGRMFCATPRNFRVLNQTDARVGDSVAIVVEAGVVRGSAALAYGLPLLLLLAGAMAGGALWGEPGAMIGAGAGLFAAWLGITRLQRRRALISRFQPHIRT